MFGYWGYKAKKKKNFGICFYLCIEEEKVEKFLFLFLKCLEVDFCASKNSVLLTTQTENDELSNIFTVFILKVNVIF